MKKPTNTGAVDRSTTPTAKRAPALTAARPEAGVRRMMVLPAPR